MSSVAQEQEQPQDVTMQSTEAPAAEPAAPTPAAAQEEAAPVKIPTLGEGDARIKKEFLLPPRPSKRKIAETSDGGAAATAKIEGGRAEAKRAKKMTAKLQRKVVKLCDAIAKGEECPRGAECKFSHNVEEFMAQKPADLEGVCPWVEKGEKCPFGLRCRFYSTHPKTKEEMDKLPTVVHVRNILSKELQLKLRKKELQYPIANKVIAETLMNRNKDKKEEEEEAEEKEKTESTATATAVASTETKKEEEEEEEENKKEESSDVVSVSAVVGDSEGDALHVVRVPVSEPSFVDDSHVRLRPEEKKRIDWRGKTCLASLTTVGNLPFRRICKQFGVDITLGEMAMANNLLSGQASEWALLKRHESEDIFGIQVCSSRPQEMACCAELIEREVPGIDFVDLNAGCPIDVVTNRGCGAALLDKPNRLGDILLPMSRVLSCPVTVKLRTGKDEKAPSVHRTIIPRLEEWGVSAAFLHGRSRQQRYSKTADWDYIEQCTRLTGVPIIGNGDIYTHYDYNRAIEHNVVGVIIGRAALTKPWIFTEIKEQRLWDISSRERLDMLGNFVRFGLEHWGSDDQGVEHTRSFLCHWLSFLYKYVPVGLLEVLPPKISDRVPYYKGRDDLETLFASDQAKDWIKITEMFLGPAPDTFKFVPKHKSNATYG